MSLIDLPAQKEILWHKMRADLVALVPYFRDQDVILCPTCCRTMSFDECSIEHILPKQALLHDPLDARQAVSQNARSGLTLLCRKPLVLKGNAIRGNGCNGWKGKHFDFCIRDLLASGVQKITTQHQVSLYVVGYLALVREFGYQISLSAAGLISRRQFFYPNNFIKDIPLNCQMILSGEPRTTYTNDDKKYWSEPFNINIDGATAHIILRSMGFRVPISRDPSIPIAKILPYIPGRYAFRPDDRTFFD